MTPEDWIERLTTGPVVETREGCRRRIASLSLGDWWALARHFGLDPVRVTPEGLARRLHRPRRRKRRAGPVHKS